jgi:hypothetical protein
MEREVIYVQKLEQNEKPVEFTEIFDTGEGWVKTKRKPQEFVKKPRDFKKIVYLGKCTVDGDMFACYTDTGCIAITKGYLNSGKY